MAALTKSVRIGVIAEEDNDVEALYELTCKIIKENRFSFQKFVGHGCGKLRHKCSVWAQNLLDRGCSLLVVVHDLDRNNQSQLKAKLEDQIKSINFTGKLVLIPVEELEAWLLCDADALKSVFRMQKRPKTPANPQTIAGPKEYLSKLVSSSSKTRYLNTVHNQKIAKEIRISRLSKCPSFSPYPKFLLSHFERLSDRVKTN